MHTSQYFSPELVLFINATTRNDVLRQMVHHVHCKGKLSDEDAFYRAIIEREKIVSTGVGMGVAIPHAKLAEYNQFFIALGILYKPVDWQALDDAPVRLIFMIGGPDDKPTEYLQLLSYLTKTIKDEDLRKKLLTTDKPDEIIALFNSNFG